VKNEYWLEVTPKRKNDATSYSKVEIYLSNTDFLPNAIHVYSVNYDPKENQFGSRYFQFADRQINGNNLQAFLGLFVRPNTPIGWTRVDADTAAASASSENSLDAEIEQNLRGTDPSIRK
jgi:hypothetical protein